MSIKSLFWMPLFVVLFGFCVLDAKTLSPNHEYFPSSTWEKKDPETLGYSLQKLQKAYNHFVKSGATALMVIDHGYIAVEWGKTLERSNCYSVRKSFLSALYGIYSNEGKIDLSKSIAQLGIDDKQKLTTVERTARVYDLLKARSGIYHPAAYETKAMARKRPQRGSHKPGTFYYYNNWDFNALGTIFEKETKESIFKAFEQRIAKPIGMKFRANDGRYISETNSIHPAYPFWMNARDRARFGLLYLRNGRWKNRQIVSRQWIEESTTAYSSAGREIGYGYMWWVSPGQWHLGNKIEGKAYSARGYWGQYIVVLPQYDLVVVQVSDKEKGAADASGKTFNKLLGYILDAKYRQDENNITSIQTKKGE